MKWVDENIANREDVLRCSKMFLDEQYGLRHCNLKYKL